MRVPPSAGPAPGPSVPLSTRKNRRGPETKTLGGYCVQCKAPVTKYRDDRTTFEHRCGQCIFCRVTKSQEWAFRLILESQQTEGLCLFTSNSYSDKHLPKTASGLPTVRIEHMREFVRKLRRNNPSWRVRYFAPTEYGKYGRPHGHSALFITNPVLPKLWEPKGKNREHLDAMRIRWRQYGPIEREILRAWGCKGGIQVAEFNQHRAAYLAKYLSKQATDPRSLHPEQEAERFTMSPGLGRDAIPQLAEEIRKVKGTLLELKKPGLLVDASTWRVDFTAQDRIGLRQPHHREKKTYPVPVYIRDKLIAHMGGNQFTPEEKRAELEFQAHLRRLDHFSKREKRADKVERLTRKRLLEQGEL